MTTFFYLGIVLVLLGLLSFVRSIWWRFTAIRARCDITGVKTVKRSEKTKRLHPVVSFIHPVTHTHMVLTLKRGYRERRFLRYLARSLKEEGLEIEFQGRQPQDAVVYDGASYGLGALFFGMLPGVCFMWFELSLKGWTLQDILAFNYMSEDMLKIYAVLVALALYMFMRSKGHFQDMKSGRELRHEAEAAAAENTLKSTGIEEIAPYVQAARTLEQESPVR